VFRLVAGSVVGECNCIIYLEHFLLLSLKLIYTTYSFLIRGQLKLNKCNMLPFFEQLVVSAISLL